MKNILLCLLAFTLALPACRKRESGGPASGNSIAVRPAPVVLLSDVTKITVRNQTGLKMEGVEITSEAFDFIIKYLEPGQAADWYLPRIGGSCGLIVRFGSGGFRKEMGLAFPLPDDGTVDEVKLELHEDEKMDASFRLKNETEFRTW